MQRDPESDIMSFFSNIYAFENRRVPNDLIQ